MIDQIIDFNCGACHMSYDHFHHEMIGRGVTDETLDTIRKCGIDLDQWLEGLKYIAFTFVFVALLLCSCNNIKVNDTQSSDVQSEDTLRTITKETAFEAQG